MSAILNTLKKLEEEKSVFEQDLDVQDLALHQEFGSTSSFVQVDRSRNNLILIVSVAIILLISSSLFFYFKSYQSENNQKLASKSFFEPPKNSSFKEVKVKKSSSVSGISMSQISGNRVNNKKRQFIASKTHKVNSVILEDQKIDGIPDQVNLPEEVKRDKEDYNRIDNEFLRLIEKNQIGNVAKIATAKSQRRNFINIPSLKLKGIIYFSDGNPANYVFVSTLGQSNVKLKVGESIMGATLQSIQSNQVVFIKDGITGFFEMGQ